MRQPLAKSQVAAVAYKRAEGVSLPGTNFLKRNRKLIAPEIRKLIFKTDKVLTFIPDTDIEQDEYFLFRVVSYHEYDSFRLSDS